MAAETGEFPRAERPGRLLVLSDVARLAGTSTAVVSYVVNDGPRPVAEKTRRKVEDAIRMLGYRRNPLAGALSGGRSNLVGLLVPDTANAFFGEMSRCLEAEGRRRGLLTLLGNTDYRPGLADEYGEAFSELRPRGIFVTTGEEPRLSAETPCVFLQWAAPDDSPSVVFDDFDGARLVTEHLLGHGYEDILCVAGEFAAGPAEGREGGWRRAMADAGLPAEGRLVRTSFDKVEAGRAVREVLTSGRRIRAVYATTDEQALVTIRIAHSLGLRVPEDLAVVGFDGTREARLGDVPLTTVRVPLEEFAVRAFDALDGRGDSSVLEGTLSIGVTCGCEPGAAEETAHAGAAASG